MQPSCQRDTGDKQGCADAHAGSVLGKIDLIGVPINILDGGAEGRLFCGHQLQTSPLSVI